MRARLLAAAAALLLPAAVFVTAATPPAQAADPLPIGIQLVHLYPDSAEFNVVCPVDPPSNFFVMVDGTLASEQSFECSGPDAAAPQDITVSFDLLTVNLKVGSHHDITPNVTTLASGTVTADFPNALTEANNSTPPATPSAPGLSGGPGASTSYNELDVNWMPPASPNGTIETYRWSWTTDCATATIQSWHQYVDASEMDPTQPYALTNLSPNCRYTISLRAYNENGGGQITTIQLDTTPLPPLPNRVPKPKAVAGNHKVTLTWSAPPPTPGLKITEYEAHQFNNSHEHITIAPLKKTVFKGLTNGKTYTFYVRALSANGPGPWSPIVTARPHA